MLKRWEKAFSKQEGEESSKEDRDRMATLVLEHMIQVRYALSGCIQHGGVARKSLTQRTSWMKASDISHTMQHWHVYQVGVFVA